MFNIAVIIHLIISHHIFKMTASDKSMKNSSYEFLVPEVMLSMAIH